MTEIVKKRPPGRPKGSRDKAPRRSKAPSGDPATLLAALLRTAVTKSTNEVRAKAQKATATPEPQPEAEPAKVEAVQPEPDFAFKMPEPPRPIVAPEPQQTPAVEIEPDIDPRKFLSLVMRGVVQANTNQMKAAVELAKIGHKPPGGVKQKRADAAREAAASSRFSPRPPPGAQ